MTKITAVNFIKKHLSIFIGLKIGTILGTILGIFLAGWDERILFVAIFTLASYLLYTGTIAKGNKFVKLLLGCSLGLVIGLIMGNILAKVVAVFFILAIIAALIYVACQPKTEN